MPYKIRRKNGKWLIVRADTGKVVGKSLTKSNAMASIRARLMAEHGKLR